MNQAPDPPNNGLPAPPGAMRGGRTWIEPTRSDHSEGHADEQVDSRRRRTREPHGSPRRGPSTLSENRDHANDNAPVDARTPVIEDE